MVDVSKLLQEYIDKNIAQSEKEIEESAKSREWFIDRIKSAIGKRTNEPVLYATEPIVNFGSYFKRTQVADVDEYDILVVIDSNTGVFSSGGKEIGAGKGTASPNHKYDTRYFKSDGSGVSPSKILNWLKGIVEEVVDSYGGTAPIRNGQAVTARIESQDINIDLVPAGIFDNKINADKIFYNIPNGKSDNGWILTNPKEDKSLLNFLAKDRENFKNVIRIIKHIRDNYNIPVPSYTIECSVMTYIIVEDQWENNLDIDLRKSLSYFADRLQEGTILDVIKITDSHENLIEDQKIDEKYITSLRYIVNEIDMAKWNDDENIAYLEIYYALRGQ